MKISEIPKSRPMASYQDANLTPIRRRKLLCETLRYAGVVILVAILTKLLCFAHAWGTQ